LAALHEAAPAYEIVRSLPMRLDRFDAARIEALFAAMRAEAETVVRAAAAERPLATEYAAFMRYAGQGHEVAVSCTVFLSGEGTGLTAPALQQAFETAYEAQFGRTIPGIAIEAISWSLRVTASAEPVAHGAVLQGTRRIAIANPRAARAVYDAAARRRLDYPVIDRDALTAGAFVEGPALIVEAQTTTVVTSRFDAQIDAAENIVLTRKAAS
jgi:N-methylhydantoinase A